MVPVAKKEQKAKGPKPKVSKAKAGPKASVGASDTAKPKSILIKASKPLKVLKVDKPEVKAPVDVKVKKARGPNKAKGSFADLLKIQNQYEAAKKSAKADLKNAI
jgi:hypothetical protein